MREDLVAPVLFSELPVGDAGGRVFGVATLNAPASLNALSLDMVRLLAPQLRAWAEDPRVIGVLLDGAGHKAFCAGGDLRQLYESIRQHGPERNPYAEGFFSEEYELDHLIHSYRKPIMVWAHGIVMGGGVGLMAGASHRVVTERTRLAMPEIGIGLFPDVGGSWFLQRMPGRTGLFLALTAAPLNASDAIHCNMADVFVPHDHKQAVLSVMATADWTGDPTRDRAELSRLLHAASKAGLPPASQVQQQEGLIGQLVAGESLADIAGRLLALQTDDPWLQAASTAFAKGSPASAAITFALWQRAKGLSFAEVLRLEYQVALGCCAHHDFAEGIRALLIDKDRLPRWDPPRLEAVSSAFVLDHFQLRASMPERLAQLQ